MPRIWRCLGLYDAESTTYTELAGTVASPFQPDFSGRLIGLRTIASRGAAATLLNHIGFRLTCAAWAPNTVEVGCQGSGLQTAPALQAGHMDWQMDQPVQSGVKITVEGRNLTADTPVTVEALIYGLFEVGRAGR